MNLNYKHYIIFFLIIILFYYLYNYEHFKEHPNQKETIVFSLTCHEEPSCIIDLIENIRFNFEDFKIIILISTIDKINNELKKLISYDNIIIVTIRDNSSNIWANIDLFHQHILNINYLIKNNIKFDHFWFIASNEYFIKKISLSYFENNKLKIISKNNIEDIDAYYNNFLEESDIKNWLLNNYNDETVIEHEKMGAPYHWYIAFKNDLYTMQVFKDNKIKIYYKPHESLVIPYDLIMELYNFYIINDIYNKSSYRFYPLEEIIISSYILSKYNVKNFDSFCLRYNYDNEYKNKSYNEIYNIGKKNPKVLSLKPVNRNYNDPLRVLIRESNK